VLSEPERVDLFGRLASGRGVTEYASMFDRRDVVQFVAAWGGDRLRAADVEALADQWLLAPEIVPLRSERPDLRTGDVIRRADGRAVSALGGEQLYTTTHMLAIEGAIAGAYERGRDAGVATVPPETL
jgi:hypothetical protein